MSTETVIVPLQDLYRFVERAFIGLGLSAEEAELCADGLVQSELRGLTAQMQGVNRLCACMPNTLTRSRHSASPLSIIRDGPSLALVDAHNGLGYAAATRAMRLAVSKARANGIGSVFVRHSTHFGGAAVHSAPARLDGGCIGIAMSNASPEMAPWGGTTPVLGTNPWAIAVPGNKSFPLVLDMALTTSGKGMMMWLANQGMPMPLDWAITRDGLTTDDPRRRWMERFCPSAVPRAMGSP